MTPKSRPMVWFITHGARVLAAVLGLSVVGVLFTSLPSTKLTLEAGTKGGLFDVMANDLADALAPHGIDVEIINRPDSLRIIDDIANDNSPIEGGFIASDVPETYHRSIRQVGTVMLTPVYLLASAGSEITSITDFNGRTISLYPEGSAAWSTCQYVLRSYGVKTAEASYGNGPTIVRNVAGGTTEVGCFIDVPSGSKLAYSKIILAELADERLRYIEIPQAEALQAQQDYLRPVTIPAGAFTVYPPRPATGIATNGAVLSFVAKDHLPQELVTMIAHTLAQQYRGSTAVNQAGDLPSTRFVGLPAFQTATNIYADGLPWMYRMLPFRAAAFVDKFLSQYGLLLTFLFLAISFLDSLGFHKPYQLIEATRPRRMKILVESIYERTQATGTLSDADRRRLESVERWLQKESTGLEQIESRINELREPNRD